MIVKLVFAVLMTVSYIEAKRLHSEKWYQSKVALYWKAKTEVRVANGRVDIVGNEYATEVEFTSKWKNAIGQALWYSIQTNKKAGIVLICEKSSDLKHLIRLRSVITHSKLNIRVWVLRFEKGVLLLEE